MTYALLGTDSTVPSPNDASVDFFGEISEGWPGGFAPSPSWLSSV